MLSVTLLLAKTSQVVMEEHVSMTNIRVIFFAAFLGLAAPVVRASDSVLSIQIAVAPENGRLAYMNDSSHFHVVLNNASAAPLRIWEDWNSWGYFALSFEISDDTGKHWTAAKRKEIDFTRNFPSFETIAPANSSVIDVYFGDGKTWDGFPLRKGQEKTVHMRAIFEIVESPESKSSAVWVGRVVSNAVQVTFVK